MQTYWDHTSARTVVAATLTEIKLVSCYSRSHKICVNFIYTEGKTSQMTYCSTQSKTIAEVYSHLSPAIRSVELVLGIIKLNLLLIVYCIWGEISDL